jgi:hypothetical protein
MLTDLAKGNPHKPDQTEKEQRPYTKGNIPVYVRPLHCFCSHVVTPLYLYCYHIHTELCSILGAPHTSFNIPESSIDNQHTTQTPEYTKDKYNVKIKVKGSLLRSHQQPT